MLNFPGFEGGFLPFVHEWQEHPYSTILIQFPTKSLSQKNYVFEQFLNYSLRFEPLPPLISGPNTKFL